MPGLPLYTYEISNWRGLNYEQNITEKQPNDIEDCRNVDFDDHGIIAKRRGCTFVASFSGTINMIHNFEAAVGFAFVEDNQKTLIAAGNTLSVLHRINVENTVDATFSISDTLHVACSTNNGIAYIANSFGGFPKMLSYINGSWNFQSAELHPPTVAPVLSSTGSASLSGTYEVIYTYLDLYGNESNPSPSSTLSISGSSFRAQVTGSTDSTIDTIGIYVLSPNATVYHYVGTISNTSIATFTATSTLNDTVIDSGDEASFTNYPIPAGKYVCIFNDMLIVGGCLDVPDQIFCSNWAYHRQFNVDEDYDRVTSNDGQPVRGFGNLYGDLIVGKADSLHLASGADNTVFHARSYNPDYGVVGPYSMLTFQKRFAFFSDDGIYVDSGMFPEDISQRIRWLLRTQNPSWVFREPTRQVSCHYKYYKKLYFAVRLTQETDGPMDSLLVYNYELDTWTVHNGFTITALGNAQLPGDYDFMFGGDENGRIYFFQPPNSINSNDDTITGSSQSINAYAETAWINLPKAKGIDNWDRATTEAMWLKIYAGGEPAYGNTTISITTTVYTDFEMTPRATYCTTHKAESWLNPAYQQRGLLRTEPKLIKSVLGDKGQFQWVKLRFANNSMGEHFKIQKVVFGFRVRPGAEE